MACRKYQPGKVPLAFLLLLDFLSGANYGISLTNLSEITIEMYSAHENSVNSKDDAKVSALTSAFLIGSMIGSLLITHVADYYGRKATSIVCCILASVLNFLAMIPVHWVYLLIIRILIGIPSSGLTTTIPMWLAELAVPKQRGILNVLFQLFVTIGIILGYVMILAYQPTNSYWGGFLLPALFFLVALVGCFAVPETGNIKYKGKCIKKDSVEENISASSRSPMDYETEPTVESYEKIVENPTNYNEETLSKGDNDMEKEIESIATEDTNNLEEAAAADDKAVKQADLGWRDLGTRKYYKCLMVAILLPICQQGCGINTVIMYAQNIFSGIDGTGDWRVYGSLIISVVNFVFTIVAIFLIERVGRRRLFLVSTVITILGLIVFIIYYSLWPYENAEEENNAKLPVLIIAVVLFLLGFELFLGPGFYVLCSESFPKVHRSRLNGIAFTLNWVVNLIIVFTYRFFGDGKTYGAFIMYLILTIATFVPIYVILPETKGKSLDEIEKVMVVGPKAPMELDPTQVLVDKTA